MLALPNRLIPKFWGDVAIAGPEECWLWTKSRGSHGYGQTWDGTTVVLAHRVAFTLANGPIPDGLTVDHLCHNRPCCNPRHLRLLTNLANATDNGQLTKTHCPSGHEYAASNLLVTPRGHRRCRACARIRERARRIAA